MTLAELVDYVCSKTGLLSENDKTACRNYVSKRYELIYNSYLWKDALVGVDVTVDPSDANNAEGVVLVPALIDRVVAVRTPERSVRVHGLEDYYRVDYNKFLSTGQPWEFALLSPVWFVWRGLVGLKVTNDVADDGKKVKITWRDTQGKRHVQTLTLASANPPLLQDDVATGNTIVGTNDTGSERVFTGTSYGWDGADFLGGDAVEIKYQFNEWEVIIDGSRAYGTNGGIISGTWTSINEDEGPEPGPTFKRGVTTRLEIESIFKQTTTGAVVLAPQLFGEDAGGTLAAADTQGPGFQRVRLFSIPNTVTTLSVLGKKKFVPLDFDQEEPALKNLDNCLIAFATAEMLEYGRQYGKAAAKMQEAGILLAELAKLETVQAANNSRIVPEDGYGDCYFNPGRGTGIGIF